MVGRDPPVREAEAAPGRATDWSTIILMSLGFGLVGIDRFMISTLYPVIAKDLHLGYADIGAITGALALAWGVAALFMGNLSDRIGRRLVLAGALTVFALLIGASGLATGLSGLIIVRLGMGFADGAYTPASIAATLDAAPRSRHGLAIGIQQMMLPACGLGLAPLAVNAMLHVMDWRLTFVFFALPGFILAAFVWRKLPRTTASTAPRAPILTEWRSVLAYRNVRLSMALMLCWLTCLITTSAFMPSYLIDHLKLTFGQMSGVMSAIGIGSGVGTVLLAWLSDRIGRKTVIMLSSAGACVSLLLLGAIGPTPAILFAALFAVHFFNNAAITMTVGPICAEAVPVGLMATASGVVIATGELLGGGLAPFAAGHFAAHFGIERILWLPIGGLAIAFLVSLFLIETRVARLQTAT